ncbi:hypothetical protein RFF05_06775 [Bengtsoniella intestinalis]|uniref:hypothetical protein n=1 Tax=Bengtsoniella intestinalis TaxID=3073143 RepID=UPI00391EF052
MSNFLDMVAADNVRVFTNEAELGSKQTIICNGKEYADLTVTLTQPAQSQREALSDDHIQGIYKISAILNIIKRDLDVVPEQGSKLKIKRKRQFGDFFETFYVVTVRDEFGLLRLELEALDE